MVEKKRKKIAEQRDKQMFAKSAMIVVIVCLLMAASFGAGYYFVMKKETPQGNPPSLVIQSPQSGTRVNETTAIIVVKGTTDADKLEVNGLKVSIRNKTFETLVALVVGRNDITIEATKGGNVNRVVITVIRGPYPLTVVDNMGRTVDVEKRPMRIVSLAPTNTEILYAIGAGSRVVGVTDYCDYPPDAKTKEKVGGFVNPNVEKILSLTPDLVAAYYGQETAVGQLENSGIPVLCMHPQTIEDVFQNIKLLGLVTDTSPTADALVKSLENRLRNITAITSQLNESVRPRVYYELWCGPYYTAGPGSFVDDLIRTAGGMNIAAVAASEWPVLTEEFILSSNPQVIITSNMNMATPEDIKNRTGWDVIDAVKNDKVYLIDGNLVERAGPRLIDGLELLYNLFYTPAESNELYAPSEWTVLSAESLS